MTGASPGRASVLALALAGALASHASGWAAPAAQLQNELATTLRSGRDCRGTAAPAPESAEAPEAPDQALRRAAVEAGRRVRPVEARLRASGATSRRVSGEVAALEGQVEVLAREIARLQSVLAATPKADDRQVVASIEKEIGDKRQRMDELGGQVRRRQGELIAAARKTDEIEQQLLPLVIEARVLSQTVAEDVRQCP